MGVARPWSVAWQEAAVGPAGFYRSERPAAHFATRVSHGESVAARIRETAVPTLARLAHEHGRVRVVDAGSGEGALLASLLDTWPAELMPTTDWLAIDLRPRPKYLDARIEWRQADVTSIEAAPQPGLVVAHELLDDIPCDVVEPDDDGRWRLVLVDPESGAQRLGPLLTDLAACDRLGVDPVATWQWCDRWWPSHRPASRIEVGRHRDAAWARLRSLVGPGLAIAVDYAHVQSDREHGVWDGGTLTGYRGGAVVRPVPDGGCNLTAHVALDACAAAVPAATTSLDPSDDADDIWWLVQWTA